MTDSLLLNSPLILICYGIALFLCVFELFKRSSGYVIPIISACVSIATTAYALVAGISATEAIIVILIFLILHLTVFSGKRGGDGK